MVERALLRAAIPISGLAAGKAMGIARKSALHPSYKMAPLKNPGGPHEGHT
jgi:hypothetical protein